MTNSQNSIKIYVVTEYEWDAYSYSNIAVSFMSYFKTKESAEKFLESRKSSYTTFDKDLYDMAHIDEVEVFD